MLEISKNILQLPKRELKKWISAREKEDRSQDWKDKLAEIKAQMNVKGTGRKSKKD